MKACVTWVPLSSADQKEKAQNLVVPIFNSKLVSECESISPGAIDTGKYFCRGIVQVRNKLVGRGWGKK
jgi:hypothetical protein